MAHLITCLGSGKGTWNELNKIIASGLFDKIYIVTNEFGEQNYVRPNVKEGVVITLIRLDFDKASEDLVPELYLILKKHFMQDKVQDLDMAVNITSGTGKEHSIVISTMMKLGYGIRLVDLDKNGNILEMI
ncbi:MAG: hypothetical protein ACP5NW_02815 [Candidatus Woesearchaeota archaeon]